MDIKENKIINKITSVATSVSSVLIPIFQYVPCTAIWFGIMSVPFIAYLAFFFQNPGIFVTDLAFLFSSYEIYIIIIGFTLYISSLIYQITHRKRLIRTGPYRIVRHPQYVSLIIMTFGMTLVVFKTSPVVNFELNINEYSFMLLIWAGEVLAYIILAKIEDYALKAKYGDEFLDYANQVSFMIPFLKIKMNNIKEE